MLTLFSCPKAFQGRISTIQRNAIKSWLLLCPAPEIILVGDDEGTKETCEEFGVKHLAAIQRNCEGTPLVSSVFSEVEKAANSPLLCYINADIILMSDFMIAINQVIQKMSRFLMVGRRWDLDMKEDIGFSANWERELKLNISRHGKLHAHSGIDYFIFPKGVFGTILPFALGRTMWDNWLIYRVRSRGTPVVDLTSLVTIVHQNHDYSHYRGTDVWKGAEALHNQELAGGYGCAFTVINATHKLTKTGLRKNLSFNRFYYEINRYIRRMLR